MKPETISIETPNGVKLNVPTSLIASTFITAALAQVGVEQSVQNLQPAPTSGVPAIGEYWPGQGGHNGGLVPARDGIPAHYLIIAAQDAGSHEWGGRGKESSATSKRDGLANTQTLLAEGGHPAASACAEYQADGNGDFYLPAAAELYQCWLNVPDMFDQSYRYWSSTQRSAHFAFDMHFVDGFQSHLDKDYELRVRPVRRAFI